MNHPAGPRTGELFPIIPYTFLRPDRIEGQISSSCFCSPICSIFLGANHEVGPRHCGYQGSQSTCRQALGLAERGSGGDGNDLGAIQSRHHPRQLLAGGSKLLRGDNGHCATLQNLGVSRGRFVPGFFFLCFTKHLAPCFSRYSHQKQNKGAPSPILEAVNEVKETAANAKQEVQQGVKNIEKKL